jgi:hypothetical protein
LQDGFHQVAPAKGITCGVKIGSGLARAAIDGMTLRAEQALFVVEKLPATFRIPFTRQRVAAVIIQASNLGCRGKLACADHEESEKDSDHSGASRENAGGG